VTRALLAAAALLAAVLLALPAADAQPAATTAAPAATAAEAAPAAASALSAALATAGGGGFRLEVDLGAGQGGTYGTAIRVFLLLTLLSLAPALLLSVTSFTRIVVVLGFLRQATGVQQLPPNQVLVGLALFLSLFTMAPVWQQVKAQALDPYEAGELDEKRAFALAAEPLSEFMLRSTSEDDIALFLNAAGVQRPTSRADIPLHVLVPAYMLSELKTSFQMGALLFFPFLVVDLIVASVLMSMGMMMVPPVMVALPIKVILFVLVDGWHLVVTSLLRSLGLAT
jgi:flagellar biosynthetic protein FliP